MYNFFFVLCLLTVAFGNPVQLKSDCEIDITKLREPAPLVLHPSNLTFVYPPAENIPGDQTISLVAGDVFLVACPNGMITNIYYSTAYATCSETGYMVIDDKEIYFNSLQCSSVNVRAENTTRVCAEGGKIIEIGYMLGIGMKWLPILEVCFNAETRNSLYTRFLMPKAPRYTEFYSEITEQDSIYNMPTSMSAIYLHSKDAINKQLGLDINSNKYVSERFYRRRLTTEKEVFYSSQDKIVSLALNTFPEWPKRCNNWNNVDDAIFKYSVKNGYDLVVYSGTYGNVTVMHEQTFEDVTLHLWYDEFEAVPVPGLLWRLAYEPISQKAIVFLTVNVPIAHLYEKHVICDDISSEISWQPWEEDTIRNVSCGYSYACSYEAFASKVSYAPKLEVSGLLL